MPEKIEFNLKHQRGHLEILEFKGEFVLPEELEMQLDGTIMRFASSFIRGSRESAGEYLVFKRDAGALTPAGVCTEKVYFRDSPRYVSRQRQ